ncbi:uncharacterized protein LOC106180153 isoform X3 [Lingula anatina]|uniref:Uncharacterized protein LOC106180153 isoform X1 n=1 Tax=Lingula anatina TaxID=7574 RepID=A0A1S3KA56_LINAN|nr:uncharacterized protein LOC106180153 isoform X1 [Lingula anatina]XP_013419509.1 uncharacterized protein LOC106180153 isoform X2 [Lingula anatina]XP_013419510.1 uncharacterized protein LOC106180153 isoform X3 [Lingula anatina]|eukprot:XP_013419508.1 uncharacterized protein LOC106180153 isoform X1 [Lingula anatina]
MWGSSLILLASILGQFSEINGQARPQDVCVQGDAVNEGNCYAPKCYCSNMFNFPRSIEKETKGKQKNVVKFSSKDDIPQMVAFTFNDPVDQDTYEPYMDLFYGKQNPNGCPVSVTIFTSDNNTDYCMINQLYRYGYEIANSGKSRKSTVNFWQQGSGDEFRQELSEQIELIHEKAEIPRTDIRGWRTPLLQPGGDKLFRILHGNNFVKYDATILAGPQSLTDNITWPFTLDYPIQFPCGIPPCPTQRYPGFWVVPVIRILDVNDLVCSFAHRCIYPPQNEEETYEFLWKNFEHHYRLNRAPFIINLEANWFNEKLYAFEAVKRFIQALLSRDDVYLVNTWQIVQWMQDPTPLGKDNKLMNNFKPWKERGCEYLPRKMKCTIKRKSKSFVGEINLALWQWLFMAIVLAILVRKDWNAKD